LLIASTCHANNIFCPVLNKQQSSSNIKQFDFNGVTWDVLKPSRGIDMNSLDSPIVFKPATTDCQITGHCKLTCKDKDKIYKIQTKTNYKKCIPAPPLPPGAAVVFSCD